MAKQIVIDIDEQSGETTIDAQGFATSGDACHGQEATKFIEEALGAVSSRNLKIGRAKEVRQNHGVTTSNRVGQR